MAYEDLLKSVEESAQEKEQELRKKAAVAIDAIRERAKRQSAEVRQAYLDEARKAVATERNKLVYLTRAENKELLIRERETAFDSAFSSAAAQLAPVRADPGYPEIFERLLREAAGAMGDAAFEIHVDPRDEEICRRVREFLQIKGEVRADLDTAGGVVLRGSHGSVVVSNTIESRLQRAREHQRHVIHKILSGE